MEYNFRFDTPFFKTMYPILLLLFILSFILTSCNTFKGLGQDIINSSDFFESKIDKRISNSKSDNTETNSDSQYVKNPPVFPQQH